MSKDEYAPTDRFVDIVGNEIRVGDIVGYSAQQSDSSIMRLAKVRVIKKAANPKFNPCSTDEWERNQPEFFYKMGVIAEESRYWRSSQSGLMKDGSTVTIAKVENVIKIQTPVDFPDRHPALYNAQI